MNGKRNLSPELISRVATHFGIESRDEGDLFRRLSDRINELVSKDFSSLVNLLYMLDVSENKVKSTLSENPGTNAGDLFAELILQRENEKAESRARFRKPGDEIPDEEKW